MKPRDGARSGRTILDLIQMVAGIVVIVGAALTALLLFATKAQLEELRCETSKNILLADANLRKLQAEQDVFNGKVTLDHLKRTNAPQGHVIRANQGIQEAEERRASARAAYDDARRQLDNGVCRS